MGILQTTSAFAYELMQSNLGDDCSNHRTRLRFAQKEMAKLQKVMDRYLIDTFDKLEEQYGLYRSTLQDKDKNTDTVQPMGCASRDDKTSQRGPKKGHRLLSALYRWFGLANKNPGSYSEVSDNGSGISQEG